MDTNVCNRIEEGLHELVISDHDITFVNLHTRIGPIKHVTELVKKEIEENAPMQRMHFAAQMEVFGSMKELMKLQLEKAAAEKALRTKIESLVVSDARVGSSVVSDAVESVAEKHPAEASDAGSSERSAALTACV